MELRTTPGKWTLGSGLGVQGSGDHLLFFFSAWVHAMKLLFEFVTIYCTGLFAGAALYITLVEHPARMECGTALAVAEFAPSYRRATVMQVSLVVLAFLSAIGAWLTSTAFAWLVGGIVIVAVIPFTLVAVLPRTGSCSIPPWIETRTRLASF